MIGPSLRDEVERAGEALGKVTVQVLARRRALGAGVLWPDPRVVVTNAHVVGRHRECRVVLADGRDVQGRVIRVDPRRDLAAITIPVDDGVPAVVRDAAPLKTGELVLALGHPFGVAGAMAVGIVHAVDRRWVRADVRLAPGFSGGPLADAAGRVVGINAMIVSGLGLAVPSAAAARFLRTSAAPRLGVSVRPASVPGGQGFLVLGVEPDSAADEMGLSMGDVIVSIDGRAFGGPGDLTDALVQNQGVGERSVAIIRGGASHVLTLRSPVARATEAA
ncbi:MAG TPA: trypsin-like peptidase domain-containing protein [Gemmatimonadales bacterium]|nr:trypsin-like peptidase domain-containing protein [Gemmatimonadales bacterium]